MAYNRKLSYGSRGSSREDFTICMFQEDVRKIESWVLKHPHNETGGDLFGLWTTAEHNKLEPVIHVVLGPGSGCRRTSMSFFQSIPYLKEVGYLLTQKYMLGHIGEWHSHHQLGLFEPSGGDSNTVTTNFPRGAYGFILIIVNILSPSEVKISPYLYSEHSRHYQTGRVDILQGQSPFLKTSDIPRAISRGAEVGGVTDSRVDTYPRVVKRYSEREKPMDIEFLPSHREGMKRQSLSPVGQCGDMMVSEALKRSSSYDNHHPSVPTPAATSTHLPQIGASVRGRSPPPAGNSVTSKHVSRDHERSPVVDTMALRSRSQSPTKQTFRRSPSYEEATRFQTSHVSRDPERSPTAHATTTVALRSRSQSPAKQAIGCPKPSSEEPTKFMMDSCVTSGDQEPGITASATNIAPNRLRRESTKRPTAGYTVASEESTGLIDVRKRTSKDQWYTTEEGRQSYQKILESLEIIADGPRSPPRVVIERSKKTQDLSMHLKHHQHKWHVVFPRDFPQSAVCLKGPHFEMSLGPPLTKDLIKHIKNNCKQCSRSSRPEAIKSRSSNTRSPKKATTAMSDRLPWRR